MWRGARFMECGEIESFPCRRAAHPMDGCSPEACKQAWHSPCGLFELGPLRLRDGKTTSWYMEIPTLPAQLFLFLTERV